MAGHPHNIHGWLPDHNPTCYYIGRTSNLRARLNEHNQGRCRHTNRSTPWRVIVVVTFANEQRCLRLRAISEVGLRLRLRGPSFQMSERSVGGNAEDMGASHYFSQAFRFDRSRRRPGRWPHRRADRDTARSKFCHWFHRQRGSRSSQRAPHPMPVVVDFARRRLPVETRHARLLACGTH